MAGALSRGALPLFRFKGIQVRLHWSFIALPLYVAYSSLSEGLGWSIVWMQLAMVGIVFACVVLHEFGHALTARHFGVGTRDITLLPIGGVASLERMPEEPRQEFWITVAGPAVNLVIAVLSFIIVAAMGLVTLFSDLLLGATMFTNLLFFLVAANLWLFLFNLIPAFPMDGGRILRSVLAMRMPRERATRIAAGLGRAVAILGMGYGLYAGQPFLALIGLFIYMAAGAEARNVAQREQLRGIGVAQVMRTRFWTMGGAASVAEARDELLAGGDTALLVLDIAGQPMGVVSGSDIIQAIEQGRSTTRLSDLPPRPAAPIAPSDDAHEATQRMIMSGLPLMPVIEAGRLVGVLELQNLQEYLRLRRAERSTDQR
ncbi:MAG: site-2 protease family protein [Flavobacteriales bacterium]|nr:site-2 protease family protein [Flavobacteriales bacterium]